jgi:DNA-directed RNA polymerase subunit M/transcription elongation factor TFIIS
MQSSPGNVAKQYQAATWQPRVICPACRSSAVRVHTTKPVRDGDMARVRYHTCRICGASFKSVEDLAG